MVLKEVYDKFYKNNKWKYIVYILLYIRVPLRQIGMPHFYGKIIGALNKKDTNKASITLLILLGIWILIQCLNITKEYLYTHMWPKLVSFSEEVLFKKIIDSYNIHFKELKVGEIVTKLVKMPWIIDEIIYYFHYFTENSIMLVSNLIYLSLKSKYLGLVYVSGVIAFVILGRLFLKDCRKLIIQKSEQYDKSHGVIEDILSNLITVYTSKQQDKEVERVVKENKKVIDLEIKKGVCHLKYKIGFSIINILIFIGLNFVAFYLFRKKQLSFSGLSAVFILNYNILNTLIIYYNNANQFVTVSADYKYLNKFLDSLPDYDYKSEKSKDIIRNIDYGINIELQDVDYIIPNTDNKLYDKLNLSIPQNQTLVIMGGIGSGKSTFAKLLVKLQDIDSGKILLNGVDSKKLNLDNIRKNIIYIPQMPILFDRTLWENISYGFKKNELQRSQVLDVMNKMGMSELAQIFNERFDKPVGKKGSFLSGGQRQIVWVLRALFGKSKVIILDEPTSALDDESKENVKKMITYLTKNRTMIIITHEQELLEGMDRVIVFDEGKIIKDKKLR